MRPILTIVSIIGAIPLLVEGIAQAIRSSFDDVEALAVHTSIADASPSSAGDVSVFVVESENIDELVEAIGIHRAEGARTLVVSHSANTDELRRIASSGAFGQVSSRESLSAMVAAVSSVRAGASSWPDAVSAALDVAEPDMPRLSARELTVVTQYVGGNGKTLEETAVALGISVQTVRAHLVSVRRQLRSAGYEASDSVSMRDVFVSRGLLE